MTKIVVVDDDRQLLVLMEELLQERKWETQAFSNGADALAGVQKDPPDAILLDIRLQGTETGWSILHRLKADPVLAAIPIVILSGDSVALADKLSWLHAHGIGVLAKPFELDDLYRAIETALRRDTRSLSRGA